MTVIPLLLLLLLFGGRFLRAQDSEGCNTEFNCFASPDGCSSDVASCNFLFKFRQNPADPSSVSFVLKANVRDPSQAYLAIGFAYRPKMSNSSIAMCKYNPSRSLGTVEHYYTPNKETPTVINGNSRQLGLSDVQVTMNDSLLTCVFSRAKYAGPKYARKFFNIGLRDTLYLIAAKGNLDDDGLEPTRHYSHTSSRSTINFSDPPMSQVITGQDFVTVNLFLMILTGVFLNVLHMNLPKYTKLLFPKRKHLRESWWLSLVQVMALNVAALSVILLIFMLAFDEWRFSSLTDPVLLMYLAVGITTTVLTILQILAVFAGSTEDVPEGSGLYWIYPSTIITIITLILFPLSAMSIYCAANYKCSSETALPIVFWVLWHSVLYLRAPCVVLKRSKVSSTESNSEHSKSGFAKCQVKIALIVGHFVVHVAMTTCMLFKLMSEALLQSN